MPMEAQYLILKPNRITMAAVYELIFVGAAGYTLMHSAWAASVPWVALLAGVVWADLRDRWLIVYDGSALCLKPAFGKSIQVKLEDLLAVQTTGSWQLGFGRWRYLWLYSRKRETGFVLARSLPGHLRIRQLLRETRDVDLDWERLYALRVPTHCIPLGLVEDLIRRIHGDKPSVAVISRPPGQPDIREM